MKILTNTRTFSTKCKRRGRRAVTLALAALFVAGTAAPLIAGSRVFADEPAWPTTPPAQICGDSELLAGPGTAPAGSVTVPAGDNSGFDFNRPGSTLWFEAGTHTLGNDQYGQIIARANMTYIGAPGAVIDGQNLNLYAFTNDVPDVTINT